MAEVTITTAGPLQGAATAPGDKSISIRALLLGALCDGDVTITGLGEGADVQSARRCIEQLGIGVRDVDDGSVVVAGRGPSNLAIPSGPLDCGNSGTTMRLLCGLLAGQDREFVLDGDASLRTRPMDRIATPLSQMGARLTGSGDRVTPPLTLRGGSLQGITYRSPVASAQVKSAILLAGLGATGETVVEEPGRSRDHTERMLRYLGVDVVSHTGRVSLQGGAALEPKDLRIPGDLSAAAFLLAAAILVPRSRVTVHNVGLNPTRTGFLDVLSWMGVPVDVARLQDFNGEPAAAVTAAHAPVQATVIDGAIIPRVIDEIPILAVLAACADGVTEIRDAAELRVKETDRIATVAENLQRMGARVEVREDGMVIEGGVPLQGARITSYGDHRIAMAFAVAGLVAEGETIIEGAEWADVSYPGFFTILEQLAEAATPSPNA